MDPMQLNLDPMQLYMAQMMAYMQQMQNMMKQQNGQPKTNDAVAEAAYRQRVELELRKEFEGMIF